MEILLSLDLPIYYLLPGIVLDPVANKHKVILSDRSCESPAPPSRYRSSYIDILHACRVGIELIESNKRGLIGVWVWTGSDAQEDLLKVSGARAKSMDYPGMQLY